ncbi:MAG: nicotinate (nicotinamide) nucleotide adenylyltransferase [Clostridia bacterium]|nr:nicotinate (nicotinamide) nucleotide adenylyltransferase [Clostridia bacterium]
MRTGIYGGTFSPPHNGHYAAALAFLRQARLDRLLIMPSLISPHKPTAEDDDPQKRVRMLQLMFEDEPRVTVSDYEIAKGGVSYTYLTLQHYSESGDTLCFLTGSDMFLTLGQWRRPDVIFSLCEVWCASRTGDDLAALTAKKAEYEKEFGAKCFICEGEAVVVSSTQVRKLLRDGDDASAYLPKSVLDYVTENDVYGAGNALIRETVRQTLSPERFAHSVGTAQTAERIGEELGLPESSLWRLVRAGYLHDCTKETCDAEQIEMIREAGEEIDPDYLRAPLTLHQLSGAVAAKTRYGCDDAVCGMIRYHCTGAPDMSLCEKIMYLADFTEHGRRYEACRRLREELFSEPVTEERLNSIFFSCCERQLAHIEEKGGAVHRLTRQTYEKEIAKMAENEKNIDLKDASSEVIAQKIKQVLDEKLAKNIEVIPVADRTVVTDYFVICNATSTTHVKSLADDVEVALAEAGVRPYHIDGIAGGEWYVLDYGVVIVHIFVKSARESYKLDRLWQDKTNTGKEE